MPGHDARAGLLLRALQPAGGRSPRRACARPWNPLPPASAGPSSPRVLGPGSPSAFRAIGVLKKRSRTDRARLLPPTETLAQPIPEGHMLEPHIPSNLGRNQA